MLPFWLMYAQKPLQDSHNNSLPRAHVSPSLLLSAQSLIPPHLIHRLVFISVQLIYIKKYVANCNMFPKGQSSFSLPLTSFSTSVVSFLLHPRWHFKCSERSKNFLSEGSLFFPASHLVFSLMCPFQYICSSNYLPWLSCDVEKGYRGSMFLLRFIP